MPVPSGGENPVDTADEVMGYDLASACRGFLTQQPEIYNVLGSDEIWDIWLFQEKLYVNVEQSQSVACVLKQQGSWTSPNMHNTARFPRLITEFYADPDRDERQNNEFPLSAKDKILRAHVVLDRFLHFARMTEQWWPDIAAPGAMRILNSSRQGELEFVEVPDGDGMMRGQVTYAVGVG